MADRDRNPAGRKADRLMEESDMIDVEMLRGDIQRCDSQNPFSGVILLREAGREVFGFSAGCGNRADLLPIVPQSRFGMASGSKTFTSVAVCQLVEQGRLSFDARIAECLEPAFPRFDPGVTVHQLLSHTSGIPDYFDEELMGDYAELWRELPMYGIREPRDFLPLFQCKPMKSAPGERWSYNNAGYILLGLVVETVTGASFPEVIRRSIFDPCGMTDTGYFAMDRLPSRTALGYIEEADGSWKTNIYSVPVVGGPDGGAFTTAPDLARFWDSLMAGRLLGEASLGRMLQPHGETETGHYGYGVWLEDRAPGFTVQMIGEDPGVAFFSGLDPVRGLQLTIMGNVVPSTWSMVKAVSASLGAAA
jgi:CubicO group peptidase (beta-lactamase class C family)